MGTKLELTEEQKALAARDVTQHAEMVRAEAEAKASVVLAKKFPRNETNARKDIEDATKRLTFAEKAYYSYPRGGKEIFGPSINLAREFARVWGNMSYGFRIVYDTNDERTVEAFAWDMQSNTRPVSQSSFRKMIQRKDKATGVTAWIKPDERDLRELTERHAAVQMRNCLLRLIPPDLVDEMVRHARAMVAKGINKKDIKQIRVETVEAFEQIGVAQDKLDVHCTNKFGHGIDKIIAEEVADLRGVWNAIKDNHAKRDEYFGKTKVAPKETTEVPPKIKMEDIEGSTQPTPEEQAAIATAEKAAKEEQESKEETKETKEWCEKDYHEYLEILKFANIKKYLPGRTYGAIVNGALKHKKDWVKKVDHIRAELVKLNFDLAILQQEYHAWANESAQ